MVYGYFIKQPVSRVPVSIKTSSVNMERVTDGYLYQSYMDTATMAQTLQTQTGILGMHVAGAPPQGRWSVQCG